MTFKRVTCAVLALSLMGTTAASAASWRHDGYRDHHRYNHGGDGLALGLGLGILTLGVIAATSAHHQHRYRDRNGYYDDNPYDNAYGDGYDYRRYDPDYGRDYDRDRGDDTYRGYDDDGD